MALIICPKCGKSVSDKAHRCTNCGCSFKTCPECGSTISYSDSNCPKCGFLFKNQFTCPECGSVISDSDEKCPNCGCPLRIENDKVIYDSKEAPPQKKKTDQAAVASLTFAIIGLLAYPIICIPISAVMAIFSGIRCNENPNLDGGVLRVIAAIINGGNLLFIFWLAKQMG